MSRAGGGAPSADPAHFVARQRRAGWLWLLVVLQVAIPASYYVRGERDDERFAWRMFSAVRVQKCQVRALDTDVAGLERPIDLDRALHSGWLRSLERGRARVIDRFLRKRCELSRGPRVALERVCRDAAGRRLAPERHVLTCGEGTRAGQGEP